MNKLCYLFLFFLVAQSLMNAQTTINDYKYIIVPKQFDFQSSEDQYQLNSLTKFLFNKYGYTAFFEDESTPSDLNKNRCLALKSEVRKVKGGFLKTKIQIDLEDCQGNIVMSSQIGDTKEKKYAKAYNIAIREAFETFQLLDYNYVAKDDIFNQSTVTTSGTMSSEELEAQKEIERLKKEVEALKEKEEQVEVIETPKPRVENNKDTVAEALDALGTIETVATVQEDMLYAQPIKSGFQIVDTTPKKVMVLLHTGVTDTYIVKGKDAVVYKKAGNWVYAENYDGNLVVKGINLKF